MIINLPLQQEARLIALAQAKGLSADALVRTALDLSRAEGPDARPADDLPLSLRLLFAKYGPNPAAEEIDRELAASVRDSA